MNCKVFDAIVIGAGVNGSSAALHLTKLGQRTALIEQFPIPHSRGSSSGQTRITRYGNTSPPSFLPIIIDSFKQWRQLEKETNMELLKPCPLYSIGKSDDIKDVKLMYSSTKSAGKNPKWLSAAEFNERFKTSFDSNIAVVEEEEAGVLMASKCLIAFQKRFSELGGQILDEFPVSQISVEEGGKICVEGTKGRVSGKYLVICAGPWSSNVLEHLEIQIPLKPLKTEAIYWSLKEKDVKPFNFIYMNDNDQHLYGIPAIEYPGMVKICLHDGVERDPEKRDDKTESKFQEIEEFLIDFVKANFPWVEPRPAIKESCMYTISPDNQMILDKHPKYKNIVYGCGFSGSGFKTGTTVGQILAEMVLEKEASFDASAFSSRRFQVKE